MRRFLQIAILLFLPSLLFGALFPGYDFTFSETVADSLMSFEGDAIGVDYTGYGYIGGESRTGIYIRVGIQAPYSSLLSIFSDPSESPEEAAENLERSFIFSFNLGPAFRKAIGDEAIWYMGLGAAFTLDYLTRSSGNPDIQHTLMNMDFGADMDMGIRIDLEGHTTIRIGVHTGFTFFSINTSTTAYRKEAESNTVAEMIPNIFLPKGQKSPMSAEGYISLGHTFRQHTGDITYRYSTRSPELFQGQAETIRQEEPSS